MGGPEIHIGDVGTQSVSIVAASLNKASGLYLGPVKGANTLKVSGNTVEIVASAKNVAKGVDAGKGADVTIGSSNAESVSISGIKTGTSKIRLESRCRQLAPDSTTVPRILLGPNTNRSNPDFELFIGKPPDRVLTVSCRLKSIRYASMTANFL